MDFTRTKTGASYKDFVSFKKLGAPDCNEELVSVPSFGEATCDSRFFSGADVIARRSNKPDAECAKVCLRMPECVQYTVRTNNHLCWILRGGEGGAPRPLRPNFNDYVTRNIDQNMAARRAPEDVSVTEAGLSAGSAFARLRYTTQLVPSPGAVLTLTLYLRTEDGGDRLISSITKALDTGDDELEITLGSAARLIPSDQYWVMAMLHPADSVGNWQTATARDTLDYVTLSPVLEQPDFDVVLGPPCNSWVNPCNEGACTRGATGTDVAAVIYHNTAPFTCSLGGASSVTCSSKPDICAPGYRCFDSTAAGAVECRPAVRTQQCNSRCDTLLNCFTATADENELCFDWHESDAMLGELFPNGNVNACKAGCGACRPRCTQNHKAWGFSSANKCNNQLCPLLTEALEEYGDR